VTEKRPPLALLRNAGALYAAVLTATLLAGFALFSPSLSQGMFADDFVATAMLDGTFAAPRGALDLFNFADGSAADLAQLKRMGSVPWWAPDDFRVSFMRPLSSALWHVDRALFGTWYVGYHLHSLLAWGLLACAAALLYRALLPLSIGLLALPMFALDHSLHFATTWLSNRGGLYATALGALAVLCHVRARDQGRPLLLAVSASLWAIALAFGEWAFPMLAYVLAYELFDHGLGSGQEALAARAKLSARARALAPAALLGILFVALRAKLGYGATGSGAYVDPADETGLFVLALIGRVPVFIADMLFNVQSSWWDHGSPWRQDMLELELLSPRQWMSAPDWRFFHTGIAVSACALAITVYRLLVRKLPEPERRRMTFLLTGALLSLVPVVGSFPSTRLTMAAFLGFAPLIALALRSLVARAYAACTTSWPRAATAYAGAWLIVMLHIFDPLSERITAMIDHHRTTVRWVDRAPLDDATVGQQHVYLLASSEFTTTFFFAYIWAALGHPLPKTLQPLCAAPYALDIARTGPGTLSLATLGGGLLTSSQEHMFRSARAPVRAGDHFSAQGFSVRVLRETAGQAQAVEIAFERSLDDPSMVLLVSTPLGFERWYPPAIGQLARVPRAAGPSWPGLEHAAKLAALGWPPEAIGYRPTPLAVAFDPDP
jgi:hypothetical protein